MTSLRTLLTDGIRPHLPANWDIRKYTEAPDVLARPVVMVDITTLAPGPAQGILQAGAHVYVLMPGRDSAQGNADAVDDAMPLVVDVLNHIQSVTAVSASRVVFADTYPCWDIDLTLYVPIIDEPDLEPEEEE